MIKPLLHIIKLLPFKGKKFYNFIWSATGLRPNNMELYQQAMVHKSAMIKANKKGFINNERLEYLGDAILGAIVAEILFEQFPNKNEGFLTKTRARIVNRNLLNNIAYQMGLQHWVKMQSQIDASQTSILGDALEALIGAVYVDKGYSKCKAFIQKRLIDKYINLHSIAKKDTNYKSILIEWGQKHKKNVNFVTEEIHEASELTATFIARAIINEELLGEGEGYSKKEAQQNAAHQALQSLEEI